MVEVYSDAAAIPPEPPNLQDSHPQPPPAPNEDMNIDHGGGIF